MMKVQITPDQKKLIERTLEKGDRVEIIPVKNGVKILKVKREELKSTVESVKATRP